jgi:hypothetical protein
VCVVAVVSPKFHTRNGQNKMAALHFPTYGGS